METFDTRSVTKVLTVWGIYGDIGNGKTLKLIELAEAWAHLRKTVTGKKIEAGLPVYGNLTVFKEYVPTYRKITCDQFMNLDAHQDLIKAGVDPEDRKTHALCIITEPYAWLMDARMSASTFTRAMAKKGLQSRKGRLDIPYDTQIPSSIDKRFRKLCKVTELALEPIEDKNGDALLFRYAYFGRYQQKLLGIDRKEAQRLFDMYESEEQIEAEFSEEFLAKLEERGDIGDKPQEANPANKSFIALGDGTRVYAN